MSSNLAQQLIAKSNIPPEAHRTILAYRDLGSALISSGITVASEAWLTAWDTYQPGSRVGLAGAAPDAQCINHALSDPSATSTERFHIAQAASLDAASWDLLMQHPLDADEATDLRHGGRMTLHRSLQLTRMDTFGSTDRLVATFAVFAEVASSDCYSDDDVLADLHTCVTYMRDVMADPGRVGIAHRFVDHLSAICWRRPGLIDRLVNDPAMACGLGAVTTDAAHHTRIVAHAANAMAGSQTWTWLWAHDLYRMLERPELDAATRNSLVELIDEHCDPVDTDALQATRTGFTRAGIGLASCKPHEFAAIIAASWRHDDPGARAGNLFLLGDVAAVCDETNAHALMKRLAAVKTPARPQMMVAVARQLTGRFPQLPTPTTDWWKFAVNGLRMEERSPAADPKVTGPNSTRRREPIKPATERQWAKIGRTTIGDLDASTWPMAGRALTRVFAGNADHWLIALRLIDESCEQTLAGFADAVCAITAHTA